MCGLNDCLGLVHSIYFGKSSKPAISFTCERKGNLETEMIKVRLFTPSNSIVALFSECERDFYYDYSKLVFSELSKDTVHNFLLHILREEGIDITEVKDVRIMRFPFGISEAEKDHDDHKKNHLRKGQYLGSYMPSSGRIDIYPPRLSSKLIKREVDLTKKIWDKEEFRFYFFCFEPVNTLLHEFLHLKYKKDESTVKKLSKTYMSEFERKRRGKIQYSMKDASFLN